MLTKHPGYLPLYEIEGTVNFDQNPAFHDPRVCPGFQDGLANFKNWLIGSVDSGDSKTIYKFGDGDYYFLKKIPIGSASPGKRAISKSYESLKNHNLFVEGVLKNDIIAAEIYNVAMFKDLFPNANVHLPAEYGYGLVANRWLTRQFAGKIGLIGADRKLELIRSLLKNGEYQQFLGLEDFSDYIKIPQKFACDDLDEVESSVAKQLENCKEETKIFLVGVGHVKSGLLHRLKKYKNAIFYDVGSGIDALSGIVDFGRPFMGAWTNYRMKSLNYENIDFLQYIPDPSRERWI